MRPIRLGVEEDELRAALAVDCPECGRPSGRSCCELLTYSNHGVTHVVGQFDKSPCGARINAANYERAKLPEGWGSQDSAPTRDPWADLRAEVERLADEANHMSASWRTDGRREALADVLDLIDEKRPEGGSDV